MTWATGCGKSGWVSPFGGRAKLPWNLEWAAQWSLFGVTIEPCGKDLSTAGGSRDRSDAIAREVFEREPPLNVPYEFINIGGKKMSTSKGLGAAAHEIVDVIKPEQLRFFFLRPKPNHAVDFDPIGTDAVPRLYDEFDRFAAATAGKEVRGEIAPGFENTFRYSLLDPDADVAAEAARFRPAFAHLALLLQIPNVDVSERMEAEKGSPLDERERADPRRADRRRPRVARVVRSRQGATRRAYATGCPPRPPALDDDQRRYLAAPRGPRRARSRRPRGDAWQNLDLQRRRRRPVSTRRRRSRRSTWRSSAARTDPRAGWLLASLDAGFVIDRLREASPAPVGGRGMSVGLQRLREDADTIRKGAIDKGEDPAIVDQAIASSTRGAASSSAMATRSRPSGTRRPRRSASAIKDGAKPDGPEVAELRRRSVEAGERIAAIDKELADVEAQVEDLLLRIPNPADPDVPIGGEEANVTVRTWGEQLPAEQPLDGEVGADAPAGGATWRRKPHWEIAEALDIIDLPRGAKIAGSGLPRLQGRRARGSSGR